MTQHRETSGSGPEASEQAIESLLQTAGRRPPVPAADAEIVRTAVRAQWEWKVRQLRRRTLFRRTAMGLAAAAALALAIGPATPWWPGSRSSTLALVERVYGAPRAGEQSGLDAGSTMVAGDLLTTALGQPSRAVVRLASGPVLRLDIDTTVRFEGPSTVTLVRGGLYIDSGSGPGGPSLEVLTPLGNVRDIGTRFEVRLAPTRVAVRIRVRDGEVVLDNQSARRGATAGEELSLEADGSVERRSVPAFGPAWDWIRETLPAFGSEGATLGEFLRWAAHEGGWELVWSEETDPETAAEHVLYGSIEGLSLEQALELTLLAEGLGYRLDEAQLIITPGL